MIFIGLRIVILSLQQVHYNSPLNELEGSGVAVLNSTRTIQDSSATYLHKNYSGSPLINNTATVDSTAVAPTK